MKTKATLLLELDAVQRQMHQKLIDSSKLHAHLTYRECGFVYTPEVRDRRYPSQHPQPYLRDDVAIVLHYESPDSEEGDNPTFRLCELFVKPQYVYDKTGRTELDRDPLVVEWIQITKELEELNG